MDSKENQKARARYHLNLKEKNCGVCNAKFIGTAKRKTCSKECTKTSKLNGMQKHYHRIVCKDCNAIIFEKVKYGSKSVSKTHMKRCTSCSRTYRCEFHKRRSREKIIAKSKETDKFEKRILANGREIYVDLQKEKAVKENMSVNNPMLRNDVKERVSETIRRKYRSGDLVSKKGPEHPSWKGNRSLNSSIRIRLLQWRKDVMARDGWKCKECGTNKKIEVHHLEKLSHIIDKFTEKPLSQYDINSTEFNNLREVVATYHNNNLHIGETLCVECHANKDEQRRHTLKK
jgi:hypothetical protein